MTWLLAIGFGLLIGLVLGALGGGGAVLTVPVLVYLLGQTPQEATASSLVIVGVTAIVSALHHARSGNVRWGVGVGFAGAGILASIVGSALNARVDGQVILLSFAAVMVISAVSMLWRTRARGASAASAASATDQDIDASGAPAMRSRTHEERASRPAARRPATASGTSPLRRAVEVIGAGLAVGFLTGFLGVGGGFVIVPALVAVLGFAMPAAVGTSLLIISLNSGVSLIPRLGGEHLDWAVIVPFTLAAVLASLLGKTLADRLPAVTLTRIFAGLLLAVAAFVLVESL